MPAGWGDMRDSLASFNASYRKAGGGGVVSTKQKAIEALNQFGSQRQTIDF